MYDLFILEDIITLIFKWKFIFFFQCPAGYYAETTGFTTCIICPKGSKCPDSSVVPVDCGSGEVSLYTLNLHNIFISFRKSHVIGQKVDMWLWIWNFINWWST